MPYKSALIGNVFFTRWEAAPSLEDIAHLKVQLTQIAQQVSGKYVYVTSVSPKARVPNAEQRKGVNEIIVECQKHCPFTYIIIEGTELQHNLQRVIMTGLLIVTRIYDDFLFIHRSGEEVGKDLSKRLGIKGDEIIRQARTAQVVL